MAHVPSHYDNLKVVRNAPPEVIRAAFRALAQRYHPDRNPNDLDAARIMSIVNEAYRVLSNPELRKEHDSWLAHTESQTQQSAASPPPPSEPANVPASPNGRAATEATFVGDNAIDLDRAYENFVRAGPLVAVILIILVLLLVVGASR